jgi:hypothetical protein
MKAAAFMMVFTVDTAIPNSHSVADKLYFSITLIFISKSMAVHLRDGSLFTLGAHLPPATVQNMKIFYNV